MWATFRRDHPEVTLVLPPDAAPREPEATQEQRGPDDHTPAVLAQEAASALDSLARRVMLIAEVLHVDEEPTTGWRGIGEHAVQPQASLRAPATDDTPTDRAVLGIRLEQLGWTPEVRNESDVVWIDATTDGLFVRVTIFDGIVTVRGSGATMHVGAETAAELIGSDDD